MRACTIQNTSGKLTNINKVDKLTFMCSISTFCNKSRRILESICNIEKKTLFRMFAERFHEAHFQQTSGGYFSLLQVEVLDNSKLFAHFVYLFYFLLAYIFSSNQNIFYIRHNYCFLTSMSSLILQHGHDNIIRHMFY